MYGGIVRVDRGGSGRDAALLEQLVPLLHAGGGGGRQPPPWLRTAPLPPRPDADGGAVREGFPGRGQGPWDGDRGEPQDEASHRIREEARGSGRQVEEARRRQGVRGRSGAGSGHRRPENRSRFHVRLQGGIHGPPEQIGDPGPAGAPEKPDHLPRRPVRPATRPGQRPPDLRVAALRLPPLHLPGLLQPPAPRAHRPLHLRAPRDPPRHQGQPATAGKLHLRRQPLRLQPPHRPRPHHHRHCPRPEGLLCHIQRQSPLQAALPNPGRGADPRPRSRRGHDQGPAGEGRPGGLPRGNHLQGAFPPSVQRLVRRAQRPDRPRGDGLQARHVLRDDGPRGQVLGPLLLLHEPEAEVRGDVPREGAGGDDGEGRREVVDRGGELRAEDAGRRAWVRVHWADEEG
ncbi:unnamed protein product [Linum tenue]|uniref:Uncharacterized protein n=1 Tax=Linum tenue TaxID=586396 RepID=A0AAV0PGF9_9ROSI|nr:unnamed protein product [Linum tenue]